MFTQKGREEEHVLWEKNFHNIAVWEVQAFNGYIQRRSSFIWLDFLFLRVRWPVEIRGEKEALVKRMQTKDLRCLIYSKRKQQQRGGELAQVSQGPERQALLAASEAVCSDIPIMIMEFLKTKIPGAIKNLTTP